MKRPKTTYKNKKLAPGIGQYVVEHIQNLDQVLAELERMRVTISRARSQFRRTSIKIIGYICDIVSRYPDISKVLKILDWPEYTNTTSTWKFLRVSVYYQIWIKNFAHIASPIYYLLKKNTPFAWEKKQVETIDLLKLVYTTPPLLVSLDYSEGTSEIILAVDTSFEE